MSKTRARLLLSLVALLLAASIGGIVLVQEISQPRQEENDVGDLEAEIAYQKSLAANPQP